MKFQRGPVLAYAAVVLIGMLVLVQTLSPDVSSLHRVPRTLAGQADFTVVPPAPDPDVSGVDAIPGTGNGSGDGAGAQGEQGEQRGSGSAAQPGRSGHQGGDASENPPASTPKDPPVGDPTTPPNPGGDESDDPTPPTLVPTVGPIPGIMAPLLWPFVSSKDSKSLDEAVPMFLEQFVEADGGATVEALPGPKKDETISAGEAPKVPSLKSLQSQSRRYNLLLPKRESEEKTCDSATDEKSDGSEDMDKDKAGETDGDKDGATPTCDEACAEPESPVGSSPAPESTESDDPDAPSEEKTTEAPATDQPSDGSKDKTCAEESAQ